MDWISSIFSAPTGSASASSSPQRTISSPNSSQRRNSQFNSVPNNRVINMSQSVGGSELCTCNDLIDSLLNYLKNNYGQQFDPYTSEDKVPIDLGNWASFMITESIITGCSSITRTGNFTIKSQHQSKDSITVCGNVQFSDLVAEFKFDSKLGKLGSGCRIPMRNKNLHIWVTNVHVHIEIALNARRQSLKISKFEIVSIDNLCGKSGALPWPFNKVADTILRRQLTNWKLNCNNSAEQIKHMINQYLTSGQYLGDIFSHINFSDLIDKI